MFENPHLLYQISFSVLPERHIKRVDIINMFTLKKNKKCRNNAAKATNICLVENGFAALEYKA